MSSPEVGLGGLSGTGAAGEHTVHVVPGQAPGTELEKGGSRFYSRKPLQKHIIPVGIAG